MKLCTLSPRAPSHIAPTSEDSTFYANMKTRNEVKAVRVDSQEASPETKMAGAQRRVRADRDKGLIASLLRRVQFMGGPMPLCPLKCSGTTGRQERRQRRKAIVESELCWA